MKTIQFNLFGREILLGIGYIFHCVSKPKPLTFQSLQFVQDDDLGGYAEMRIGGAYLIRVRNAAQHGFYHVEIFRSGEKVETRTFCIEAEITDLMQMIQNGEYKEPSDEDTHRDENRETIEEP